jgi:O-antigen biosynthesis protein
VIDGTAAGPVRPAGTDADEVAYADGAEDDVLAALLASKDVSAGSDELAARGRENWEMAYHFSPRRLGLLAPLRLGPGTRVADLGCGSGVLTRALGESGATVVGIEGVRSRAAAARVRCADLPNVEIIDGRAEVGIAEHRDLDIVLICGLLEYTAKEDGPDRLLAAATQALAPGGVLVVAIENQLGLGYLAGRHEDHHATPWVGLADYPLHRRGPRTWTSHRLRKMFSDHGLPATRWIVPYPDYKIPRVLLDAAVFDRPDGAELVDKLVRAPLPDAFRGSEAVVSGRRFQRVLLEEGLGLSTAPCFLVVCARTPEAITAHSYDDLGWMITNSRLARFRRVRALTHDLRLRTLTGTVGSTSVEWLTQHITPESSIAAGRPLDSLLLDALHDGDEEELHRLLRLWHDAAAVGAVPGSATVARHPFLPGRVDVERWAADRIDCHPGNWIVGTDGVPVQIDDEWRALDGVDAELAALRALFTFALEIVASDAPHPWPPDTTLDTLLVTLCKPLGLAAAATERWDEFAAAEAALQEIVSGIAPESTVADLHRARSMSGRMRWWDVFGGLSTERARLEDLEQRVATLRGQVTVERRTARRALRRAEKAETSLAAARARAERNAQRLGRSQTDVSRLESLAAVRVERALRRRVRGAARRAMAVRRRLRG